MPPAPDARNDVYRIYDDLKRRALGISDVTKPPEGFIVSFLPAGRPVNSDDYSHPWTPDLTQAPPPPASPATPAAASPATPAVASPAIPDAAVLDAITKRQRNLQNLSQLVNHKLQLNGSGQVEPSSTKVSDTWEVILKGASAVPLPPINPEQKKALEAATRLLVKPDPEEPETLIETNSYKRYREYKKKYFKAVQSYTAQYVAAMMNSITAQTWPVLGRVPQADVESAMDDWVSLGKKSEIEDALNLLDAQGSDAATALIASGKKRFDKYQVAAGMIAATVPYVQVFPTNWCDPAAEDDGWTEYEYDSSKSNSEVSAESTSWGASAGVNYGLWSVGANVSASDAKVHSEFSAEGLIIRCKYAVLDIERPWLNTVLLNLRNWFLRGFKKNSISNGTINQQKPSSNEAFWLPTIPTNIIVIKDLYIQTQGIHAFHDAVSSKVGGGLTGGYGPFTLSGHYENDSSKGSQGVEKEGEGLRVRGVQIIGWISQIVPASPMLDDTGMPE